MTAKCFLTLLLISIVVHATAFAQDVIWQKEYQGMYNGENSFAYCGGLESAKLAMVDIDADGDLDLFVGESNRETPIAFIRNDGSNSDPSWVMMDENYFDLDVNFVAPAFCDIDGDGDQDFFYGDWGGNIGYYRNDGNASSPNFTWILKKHFIGLTTFRPKSLVFLGLFFSPS